MKPNRFTTVSKILFSLSFLTLMSCGKDRISDLSTIGSAQGIVADENTSVIKRGSNAQDIAFDIEATKWEAYDGSKKMTGWFMGQVRKDGVLIFKLAFDKAPNETKDLSEIDTCVVSGDQSAAPANAGFVLDELKRKGVNLTLDPSLVPSHCTSTEMTAAKP